MRALRVLGIAEDGDNLVCEDGTSGELFVLPADERLRAAVRGDLSRLGRLEIERQPQLRPREIQSRIRAGSSIAEVAAAAHTSVGRIERYAYPVLLERSTMAERARLSHPMVDGEPARRTLEELVTCTLSERGQNTGVQWDSYRDDDGWVVILRWQAGRSENHASWEIHAGPRTNTLRPRDAAARDLVDPAPHPLRPIAEGVTAGPPSAVLAAADGDGDLVAEPAGPGGTAGTLPASHHPAGSRRSLADRLDQDQLVERTVLDERAGTRPAPQKEATRTGTDNTSSRANRKGHHPVMPGWEDVLLGGGQPGG
jgi:hypothetical protein